MRSFADRVAALQRGCALCLGLLCAGAGAADAQPGPAVEPGVAPVVARLVASIEASSDSCARSSPHSAAYRAVAADVARFRERVPGAAQVRIEVRECYWDGMVLEGERIIVSSRLVRATPAQRFFVIAHEYAHVTALHHARFAELVAQLLRQEGSAKAVARALERGAGAPLSRRNETEADAIAVHLMLDAGEDPEEAARFLDDAARSSPQELDTHPSPRSRAAAIRERVAQRVASGP